MKDERKDERKRCYGGKYKMEGGGGNVRNETRYEINEGGRNEKSMEVWMKVQEGRRNGFMKSDGGEEDEGKM